MPFFRKKMALTKRICLFYRTFKKTASKSSDFSRFSLTQTNGINVISKDTGGYGTSLSVVIRSGSRFEPVFGLSHLLERFAFKNTKCRSSLRIIRETELLGGDIFSRRSREILTLSAQFLRDDLAYFVELLAEVLIKTKYNEFELNETVLPYALSENKRCYNEPAVFGQDVLHEIAFRRGLGRSIYTNERNYATVEMIGDYAKKSYVKNNLVVLATNADQSKLEELISEHFNDLSVGTLASSPKTIYYGGENRIGFKSYMNHFLISFPRPAAFMPSSEEYILLSYLLGTGSRVKWSYENSPFGIIEKNLSNGTKLLSNNFVYSDAGLFCIHIYGPIETLQVAVKSSIEALRSLAEKIDNNDIKRAISQAKYSLFDVDTDPIKIHEELGSYYLSSGSLLDQESIASRIEKITATEIKSTISKMFETKPSVVVVGDTNVLPYYDEL
ncbi:hypothetical protein PNEG_01933 [Pneumocystis murina B123]|uniref:Cytochrome b-c1 complex subunit 2, mitochondrial n=1 Tax=Pneumocystis murina (strain B123) TaxID=1069680 RepID=M7NM55_PNEMU|nr:hypothetical protein PNEG_01933 [Pneumocystis murina B123]EMR09748.1 hypothetical protein PNEG_01933 [Pneumocystis murina B123]